MNLIRLILVRLRLMRCNARVAFVLGAGPSRGLEATPNRAARRPNFGTGQSARLAATLVLFRSAAMKLAC
jgi:hypothetical protein